MPIGAATRKPFSSPRSRRCYPISVATSTTSMRAHAAEEPAADSERSTRRRACWTRQSLKRYGAVCSTWKWPRFAVGRGVCKPRVSRSAPASASTAQPRRVATTRSPVSTRQSFKRSVTARSRRRSRRTRGQVTSPTLPSRPSKPTRWRHRLHHRSRKYHLPCPRPLPVPGRLLRRQPRRQACTAAAERAGRAWRGVGDGGDV